MDNINSTFRAICAFFYLRMPKFRNLLLVIIFLTYSGYLFSQQGSLIPVDNTQLSYLKVYNLIFHAADEDYRSAGSGIDAELFKTYGEQSIYWITSGSNKGKFVFPAGIPEDYSSVTKENYSNYNWQSANHLAVQFKSKTDRIAIFKSKISVNDYSSNWEALTFKNLLETYIPACKSLLINEDSLLQGGLSDSVKLLIIPSFNFKETNAKYYIDQVFNQYSGITAKIASFLAKGGTIYTEGNAAYFIEKLGYLSAGAVSYDNSISAPANGLINITVANDHPVAFAANAQDNKIYSAQIPSVNVGSANVICRAAADNRPVLFEISGSNANGGKIVCNLGIPAVAGSGENNTNSRQLQWILNTITYAFSYGLDVTRNVTNEKLFATVMGDNAISYDRSDTFTVHLTIRNLTGSAIDQVTVNENHRAYLRFLDILSGSGSSGHLGTTLQFENISVASHEEVNIAYRLVTPTPDEEIHENIDDYLDYGTYLPASLSTVNYTANSVTSSYKKVRDYADILFSARIFADADVNWKNFLGLEYQPFKVFMIMENKQRTSAKDVVYEQYIPRDVPFYWVDHGLNIPVLKTPGGEFVDVLRGSDDQNSPVYDMDSDGNPDAWLDTASIFPKGYKIVSDEVYWANPWAHLKTGSDQIVYEDLDKDGNITTDANGDGVYESEDPDDKLRVWKVTWDVGEMKGYQYFDPYCYYELWIDPPNLVNLAEGVGYVYDSLPNAIDGMFYPEAKPISNADKNNNSWKNWMEKDEDGKVIWKQLIYQSIHNYEGYTFIDTLTQNYKLTPSDYCAGTVPVPRNEFIAVVSLGGEEIDMYNYVPKQSLYSKVKYKTIFDEERVTPIRTTYTYWAPLPNPLQFEYLSNNFTIYDTLGKKLDYLPSNSKARLVFDIDATTEYTYYWIRNVGYDVDFNDPSLAKDGVDEYGDGVFGYFVYDIPKGVGGYSITLPRKEDGSYDLDSIVQVDNKDFERWIDNPNTGNSIEIWEDPFEYHIYIPQVLIPPALDDDNHDGIDDWIDDRGDRFHSETGYLNDPFMQGIGEDYPKDSPHVYKHNDDIYGDVVEGWSAGNDNTYGDDLFENLGKTHLRINANYKGTGREGSVEISKGGVLVCEEIFGGSPWVIFSHVLSAYAKGVNIETTSEAIPDLVKYGTDTILIKHTIEDVKEPHYFNINYDPYILSFGYGESAITTIVGGKDPCNLIAPAIDMSSIIDPAYDHKNITLIPDADGVNPDLSGYPKPNSGTFTEIRIEVMNGSNDNWKDVSLTPEISAELGNTSVALQYVAYPRPLVPDDIPNTFATGWRFNQPEGEVLIKMGNTLNLLQPSRRAYYVILLKLDESVAEGIYDINFTLGGQKVHYDGTVTGSVNYNVPPAKVCFADKNNNGQVTEFKKLIIDQASLQKLAVYPTSTLTFTGKVKWSLEDVVPEDFSTMTNTLPVSTANGGQVINLEKFKNFPALDTTKIYILQEAIVNSVNTSEDVQITNAEKLMFLHGTDTTITNPPLSVIAAGPRITIDKSIYKVNGQLISDTLLIVPDEVLTVTVRYSLTNTGNMEATENKINIFPGSFYEPDSLPEGATRNGDIIIVPLSNITPGEQVNKEISYKLRSQLKDLTDLMKVISSTAASYVGKYKESEVDFNIQDTSTLKLGLNDMIIASLSCSEPDASQNVTIKGTLFNRGLPAKNIMVRLYPIVGQGIPELPCAEMVIDSLASYSSIDFESDYTLPNDEEVSFLLVVDDDKTLLEVIEANNQLKVAIGQSIIPVDEFSNPDKISIGIYPNPVANQMNIILNAPVNSKIAGISVTTMDGKLIYTMDPHAVYNNRISCNTSQLTSGIYLLELKYSIGSGDIQRKTIPFIKN